MTAFVYALPSHTTLQQEAAIARGLRGMFPDVEFQNRGGGFMMGSIIPIVGRSSDDNPDQIIMDPPAEALVRDVRTAFNGLLVEALAGPRVCEGCG